MNLGQIENLIRYEEAVKHLAASSVLQKVLRD